MGEKLPHSKSTGAEVSIERRETEKDTGLALAGLRVAFGTLFGASIGGMYARRGEEGFSGDAASLYALVSLQNERGERTPHLVKVGWGEFSRETFEGGKYPAFKRFPFDLYCVRQNDSFFAQGELRRKMDENPQNYLLEHSVFSARGGQVRLARRVDTKIHRLEGEVEPVPYEDILRVVRNEIIEAKSTPDEFSTFLQALPDDAVELGRYMANLERSAPWMSRIELGKADEETKDAAYKKGLMHLMWGMGVNRSGIAVGDSKAAESVLALKSKFDFKKKQFTQ